MTVRKILKWHEVLTHQFADRSFPGEQLHTLANEQRARNFESGERQPRRTDGQR